ncbi:hypothetical protein FHS18_003971 [Paenibacillus phyllosphaerae]|uniref:Uncharacterized protein n=1 Tax=Paenibacillus phyllosphaerae TaxID=274593 RepID=A0A7W5AZZ6_9BACL|nr:hypothetical protein [Paenibacillus phyllosphaerae]MBB3111903.1 hypothetical protein [Paenibacillus phyllosphaerae]
MVKTLDARTSQNASYGQSISITLLADTPTAIGQVGLNITGASGILRVIFNGIATLALPAEVPPDTVIALGVLRGTSPTTDPVVGYALFPVSSFDTNVRVLNITVTDYEVPYPVANDELVYSLIVYSSVECTRIGPESMNAVAYSD